jgi:hypothetical protein
MPFEPLDETSCLVWRICEPIAIHDQCNFIKVEDFHGPLSALIDAISGSESRLLRPKITAVPAIPTKAIATMTRSERRDLSFPLASKPCRGSGWLS